jgi:hypothetical protein
MDPGDRVELSDEPFPVMLVNGTDVSFVVQLDSPVFSFDTTVTDVEADTAFTLDVVPFAFQNVPAAAQSTPFSERESLTGVRYTAISPSPGLWMVRLSCDTCKNDVVNLTITATSILLCSAHLSPLLSANLSSALLAPIFALTRPARLPPGVQWPR